MLAPKSELLSLRVSDTETVSALWCRSQPMRACYVFAHGAGAGMHHSFISSASAGLAARGIATLRYQFPFIERGSKRPDPPALAHAAVRAAVAVASGLAPDVALFAGGKSFGGRMTSQAQAISTLPKVRGLIFFGFPLHPANKPSVQRAEHLAQVNCPMLFLQGTRDQLADVTLMRTVAQQLGERAALLLLDDADHSFHVPARHGRSDQQVLDSMLDAAASWMAVR